MRAVFVLPMAALAAVVLAACAPVTRVVMLPQPGHDSVVEVMPRAQAAPAAVQGASMAASAGGNPILLTKPYQSATVGAQERVSIEQSDAAEVKSRYGALLAAQPPDAQSYLLYFEFNGTQLTPESAAQLEDVTKWAMARPGNEIVVTGYTDSVGTAEANDRLSLQRAQVIRQAIIAHGFDPARVYAVGRGARDPLVPAGDQAAEEKNRRVEITVR
ncbi:MAG: OmpA family protein [Burkholderiaceae bacterium]|jgi:outer membrane protein OmpA-like peptidoglycan-associated protein|nr:OmpA family protein [Burkholderiaceae bacterium]